MSTRILILKDGVITPSKTSNDRQLALNSLVSTMTTNRVLRSNGTNIVLSQVDLTTDVIGVLPPANGGSGNSASYVDLTTAQTIGGLKAFSEGLILPATPHTTVGTIWRNGNNLEFRNTANTIQIILNSAGNLSNLSDKQTSLNNLVGAVTANRVLKGNGTNIVLSQIDLNSNDVINILPINLGGTGSSTQNFVDVSTAQTIGGNKTFTGTISGITSTMVGLGNVNNTSDINKPISTSTQNALNLKADLIGGLIPTSQLPSYVDDVLEFSLLTNFPVTGEIGKIYVATTTNITYRWSGTAYVEISASLALGTTSSTAYRGDFGNTAYLHSQSTGNPHNTTKSDVGLSNVVNSLQLIAANNLSDLASRQIALNTLAGGATTNNYLRADGTNIVLSTIQASDVPTLNQNTTGTASNVTGIVAIANGGTGNNTKVWVDLTTDQTIVGVKTFSNRIRVFDLMIGNDPYVATSTNIGKGYISAAPDFYEDYKLGVNGFLRMRIGAGAEFGYARQFLAVRGSNGDIVFNSATQATSTTDAAVTGTSLGLTGNLFAAGTRINFASLPTSSSGLPAGTLWRNGNVVNIV